MQGLSGRDSLEEHTGMLFMFEADGYHPFWMKGMRFPIDILWMDRYKRVVHIAHAVSPDTYPELFKPSVLSRYVLEVPAGYAERHGVDIGGVFVWE